MISVVMPYWERSFALAGALALFALHYAEAKIEVVVVDDGSEDKPVLDTYPFPVRVLTLPRKPAPMNPCVPINRGVEAARGDVIVITNPEILHKEPALPRMLDELEALGANGYVLAAAWCPEQGQWHCHSSRKHAEKVPQGAGYHFCAMLNRSLWDAAGGFDEGYRQGAGYDDPDWTWRLHRAGAKFKICDDIVVIHPKSGARTEWPMGGFERNRLLFESKWH